MTRPAIVPAARPRLELAGALEQTIAAYGRAGAPIILVGIRGYYRDSMGAAGQNDVGLYDDAMILIGPGIYATFNANVDPSRLYPRVARLHAGKVYDYQIGIHGLSRPEANRYKALVQAGPVTVDRYEGPTESGYFGINIHRGGYQTTGSEGCQTIHPSQWVAFLTMVELGLERAQQAKIPYLLVDAGELSNPKGPTP